MTPHKFFDNLNRRVELGSQLGVGGEGAVFEVVGQPSSVAKVYLKRPDAGKEAKLRAMPSLARPELLTVAAWPTATLHQAPQGPLAGVLMPRVVGKEVHALQPGPAQKGIPCRGLGIPHPGRNELWDRF